jgi:dihydrolipoamide dehydrogenase
VGGGVIGVELASVYNRLGSKVTIVEMLDRLCPTLDLMLSKQLLQILKKEGIEFWLSSRVESAVVQPEEVILTIDQNGVLKNASASVVLVSVGRRPYTKGLQLEKSGVQVNHRGFVDIDQAFRTSQSHIFAIGDAIEGVMLAHRASAEGIAVVESLKNTKSLVNYLSIPNVIYTDPEVATVGLTEQEVDEAGLDKMIGISHFRGNPRARCMDIHDGFVKIIGDKRSGRLIGMHIIGPHASEMISEAMLAIQKRAKMEDIAGAAQAHPTLSEAIKEAASDALGKAIHQ